MPDALNLDRMPLIDAMLRLAKAALRQRDIEVASYWIERVRGALGRSESERA